MFRRLDTISERERRTDRQTSRESTAWTALCKASHWQKLRVRVVFIQSDASYSYRQQQYTFLVCARTSFLQIYWFNDL